MLEHATYLENVAFKLCHNVVQTLPATLACTNNAKTLYLLKDPFGVDLPSKDEEDDVEEDSDSEEEEEDHLTQAATTSQVAAETADSAKFSMPSQSPSTSWK